MSGLFVARIVYEFHSTTHSLAIIFISIFYYLVADPSIFTCLALLPTNQPTQPTERPSKTEKLFLIPLKGFAILFLCVVGFLGQKVCTVMLIEPERML